MIPYLIATDGPNAGSTYLLQGRTLVGRCEDCDIQLLEHDVSRRHALILRGPDGTFRVGDLTSTNGTFVSGDRITGRSLALGDTIRMGTTTLLFLQAESYADVLRGLTIDELKLVSGPATSPTREIPLNLPSHLQKRPAAAIPESARGRQSRLPTQSMGTDMAWLHARRDLQDSPTQRYSTVEIPQLSPRPSPRPSHHV